MRGSSVNFKKVTSALHSVSHANRDVPPDYLLPEGMSLGTHVVIDDQGEVQKTLTHKMSLASGRAKASKDYSPIWEGVINLPAPSKDITASHQIEIVKAWCVEYEKLTGHKVLRADVHLDEGYVDEAGKPQYNAHAHVMADRTTDKGRVIKLSPAQLRSVQTMTAEVTSLERGIDARQTRRKHINHHNFKFDAEKNRLGLDVEKGKTAMEARLVDANIERANAAREKLKTAEATISAQAAEIERYRLEREDMKASGTATQKDYQASKKAHLATLAKLAIAEAQVETLTQKVEAMTQEKMTLEQANATLTEQAKKRVEHPRPSGADLQKIEEALDFKARFAAMAEAYQEHKAQGKDPAMFVPGTTPPEPTKTPAEAKKAQSHPIPSPTPQKPAKQALNVVITMSTGSVAFEDLGRSVEAARVVRGAADFIAQGWDGRQFDLKDTNGNKVGKAESAVEGGNFPTPPDGGILLVVPPNKDLAGTLRGVADKLETMVLAGVQSIKDAVGNVIAKFAYMPTMAEKTFDAKWAGAVPATPVEIANLKHYTLLDVHGQTGIYSASTRGGPKIRHEFPAGVPVVGGQQGVSSLIQRMKSPEPPKRDRGNNYDR